MTQRALADSGFTLALGGGGARGWAHLGVARALDAAGLRPGRIVGTSMGAIIGAALAAGFSPAAIEAVARRTPVRSLMRRGGRFALFDPRPLLEHMTREVGVERIEELPLPLGITTYDLVAGAPRLIVRGRLHAALERSIAVPLFFPPRRDAAGVWCDAGPWESVPVAPSRAWAPGVPVIGVWADVPKPAFLASRAGGAWLRAVASGLEPRMVAAGSDRLTARRYLSLLTRRWAEPVHYEAPDLLIVPRMRLRSALQFDPRHIGEFVAAGERAARVALDGWERGAIGRDVREEGRVRVA